MNKRRRPWGLLGLVGLGGLMMMGASRDDEGSDSGDDSGSGGSGDSGSDNSGGSGSGGGSNSGGGGGDSGDAPGSGDSDDSGGGSDLPPPPTPDPPSEDDELIVVNPIVGEWPTEPEPRPTKPGTTGGPKPPTSTPTEDDPPLAPPLDDPPWSELVDTYPRGARFFPAQRDDRFGGTSVQRSIAYRFLLSEAYLAATEYGGMEREDALAWAMGVGRQDKIRLQVIDLIQCSGWNDAMYGATPVKVSHASAHGRSILLRPVHGPVAIQLEQDKTPVRNVTLGGNPAHADYRHFELLWLPAIDRAVLWESGGAVITTTGLVWSDGSSMENPPPWVMALGIEDLSGALDGDFGCPGSDGELEVG